MLFAVRIKPQDALMANQIILSELASDLAPGIEVILGWLDMRPKHRFWWDDDLSGCA